MLIVFEMHVLRSFVRQAEAYINEVVNCEQDRRIVTKWRIVYCGKKTVMAFTAGGLNFDRINSEETGEKHAAAAAS